MTAPELKRHEWKLPMANWLRDEINEILARYDVPSDVYSSDVAIDATCVIAVDKISADLLDAHIGAVLDRLPEYLVAFEKDNSFRLGQVQGFIYGDDCVVRDCWLPQGKQEVLRKPASEISHEEMMDFIHVYRMRLAIRELIAAEKEGEP